MFAEADTALTLGGLIALASLLMGAIGLAISASSKTAALRERLARIEEELRQHVGHHD